MNYQDGSEKQIVQHVEEIYNDIQPNRILMDHRRIANLAEYMGKFFLQWNGLTNQLSARRSNISNADYPQLNLQLPMVKALLSQINSREVGYNMIPAPSREQEDINAAAIGNLLMRRAAKLLGIHGWLREKAILTMLIMGDSFVKQFWDPGIGQQINVLGSPMLMGDSAACIRTPLAIGVDPMAESMADCRWIMEFTVRDLDWVKERWPNANVHTETLDEPATYQMRMKSYIDNNYAASMIKHEHVVVKELWEAPTSKFPKGRVITIAGQALLDYKVDAQGEPHNPYQDTSGKPFFPYSHFKAEPVPGSFWHKSPIELTSWEQKGYNQIFWQIREWFKRTAPKVFVRKGSITGNAKDAMSNKAFDVVEYSGAQPPEFVATKDLPATMFTHMNDYRGAHEHTAGITASVRGESSANVRSNAHYMQQVEQAAQKVGPMIDRNEESWEDVLKKSVRIIQRFMPQPLMEKVVGRHNVHKIPDFLKAELGGNVDVEVVKGSMMPRSQPLALQNAMEFYQMGFYGQPGTPEARRVLTRHVGKDNAYLEPFEDDKLSAETAQQENSRMEAGQVVVARWYQDYDVHVYEHLLRMNQPDFEYLGQTVHDAYQAHLLTHEYGKLQRVQMMMQIQQQAQAMLMAGQEQPQPQMMGPGPQQPMPMGPPPGGMPPGMPPQGMPPQGMPM